MVKETDPEKKPKRKPGRVEARLIKQGEKIDEIGAYIKTKKEIEGEGDDETEEEGETLEVPEKGDDERPEKAAPGSLQSLFE